MSYSEQPSVVQHAADALSEAFPFSDEDKVAFESALQGGRENWHTGVYTNQDKLKMYDKAAIGLGLSPLDLTDEDVIRYDVAQFIVEEDVLPRIQSEAQSSLPDDMTPAQRISMLIEHHILERDV